MSDIDYALLVIFTAVVLLIIALFLRRSLEAPCPRWFRHDRSLIPVETETGPGGGGPLKSLHIMTD